MEPSLLRTALALGFVIGLIFLLSWAARRWNLSAFSQRMQQGKRLRVLEQLHISPKHKLLIVQCDNQQYLLLSGSASEQLIPIPSPEVPHE